MAEEENTGQLPESTAITLVLPPSTSSTTPYRDLSVAQSLLEISQALLTLVASISAPSTHIPASNDLVEDHVKKNGVLPLSTSSTTPYHDEQLLPEILQAPPVTIASASAPSTPTPASNGSGKNQEKKHPTGQELKECRHVKNSLSKNVWFVAVLGLCERFAYYGIIVMFQNYIQNHRYDPLRPGALGLGENIAGVMNNIFTLYTLITPILAAIIADTWLGRFRTLCLALYIYVAGLIILITTSIPTALDNGAGLPGLIVAMLVMGMGVGGVKATIGPFIADQCTDDPYTISYTKSGEKVVVDREATVEYIFNIYYWCVNAGALSGIATTFMEKDVGFWAAYLMPTSVFVLGILVFHLNAGRYVDQRPESKNILPSAFRAMLYGARGGWKMDAAKPDNVSTKYRKSVPWTASFIEELKSGLTATRAFIAFIIYWLCQTQMSTNLISQAANMNSHGIPNDLLPTINSVAVVIILPIMQHIINPILRRYHVPFRPISRMTVGFIIEAAAMAYVAGIQNLVYSRPPCYSHPRRCEASFDGSIPNDVNVLTQIPVYVLEGLGETFSNPAGYEYAYTKAPQSMKTIVQAGFQLSSAGGSALALALSPTYSDPKLLVMFSTLAGCMFLDACIFHFLFRRDGKKEAVEINDEELGKKKENEKESEGAEREQQQGQVAGAEENV